VPTYVLIVDGFGITLAIVGFLMTFRQGFVRGLFSRRGNPVAGRRPLEPDQDPLTYVLRIAGTMIMVFGIALGLMVTLFQMV
jgi:hypothetical protein